MNGFDRFRDVLSRIQKNYPALSLRMREAQAVARWEDTVGTIIAKHARALRVVEKVLWVEVDHPIWRSELHYRKKQILDAMNSGLLEAGNEVLTDIFFIDPRAPQTSLRFDESKPNEKFSRASQFVKDRIQQHTRKKSKNPSE